MNSKAARHIVSICTSAAVLMASIPFTGGMVLASDTNLDATTGYVLRSDDNTYLSVSGGTAAENATVGLYDADGVAAYNTWYLIPESSGIQVRSAISDEYYLARRGDSLTLSRTATVFYPEQDNTILALSLEAVTNLTPCDMNGDAMLTGADLTQLRAIVSEKTADFVQEIVGDADGNGVVDTEDIALLQGYLLGENIRFSDVATLPDCTIIPDGEESSAVTTEDVTTEVGIETTETTTTTNRGPGGNEGGPGGNQGGGPGGSGTTTSATDETTESPVLTVPTTESTTEPSSTVTTGDTSGNSDQLTLDDLPEEYVYAADWIWENRIESEGSTTRWNLIYDQIIAGDGTLNFVVRWQSMNTITLEQRQKFAEIAEQSINDWADWLVGYDDWPYDHVEVNIVGWAVLDKSCLLDLQPDEIVYDTLFEADEDAEATYKWIPCAPEELWRFNYFTEKDHVYPGTRFDMYFWATQGWGDYGGCGGDWGQRLSDTYYLGVIDGYYSIHILEHEIGHGFGLPDFYGEEGASDGYPPGGFPNDEWSIMCAGSCTYINDFDGWMLRYVWSKIKDETSNGVKRFDY